MSYGPGVFYWGGFSGQEFSTIDDQIKRLEAKGLVVQRDKAEAILRMENYYNVINGYEDLFTDPDYTGRCLQDSCRKASRFLLKKPAVRQKYLSLHSVDFATLCH